MLADHSDRLPDLREYRCNRLDGSAGVILVFWRRNVAI